MCDSDLKAQTRLTSTDVRRVMGGVALAGLGLFMLGIALAVGMANDQIEPWRAVLTIGAVAAVLGVFVGAQTWSHALISKKLGEVLDSARACPQSESTVARLTRERI